MPAQVHDVLVADAAITTVVSITPRELSPVNLQLGDTLRIKARYSFKEALKDKEEYFFRLKCESSRNFTLEALSKPEPVAVRFGDKWARHDKGDGILEQPFKFDRSGEYAVRFEVDAEYRSTRWGDPKVTHDLKKTSSGTLRVHVKG